MDCKNRPTSHIPVVDSIRLTMVFSGIWNVGEALRCGNKIWRLEVI